MLLLTKESRKTLCLTFKAQVHITSTYACMLPFLNVRVYHVCHDSWISVFVYVWTSRAQWRIHNVYPFWTPISPLVSMVMHLAKLKHNT